jgi:FkbM family methyltransferase
MFEMQTILARGPSRQLVIGPSGFEVTFVNPKRVYGWNPSDPRTAIACLVAVGEYEPIETHLLKAIANRSQVVIDVGSNVGYYAVELGKVMGSFSRLLAIEPVLESFKQLQRNVQLNELNDRVNMFMTAVGSSEGTAEIFIPETSGSSAASTRNLHNEENHSSQIVHVTTVDAIMSSSGLDKCDLIKIDVEGAELMVLQGATRTIKKHKPVIFAELLRKWSSHFSYNPNSVLQLLAGFGYQCWGVSSSYRKIEEFTENDEETNFIFIHESDPLGVIGLVD